MNRRWLLALVALAFVSCAQEGVQDDARQGPNPFEGEKFYVDPESHAKQQADRWWGNRPEDAAEMYEIAAQPGTYYFSEWTVEAPGGTEGQVDRRVSEITSAGALPVLGAYAIPRRDCGSYSAGGFDSADEYKAWISDFADGIGDRKAVVILEPDALAAASCLTEVQRRERYALIEYAVEQLEAQSRVSVYVDAGNPGWQDAEEIASRLAEAGIGRADGFSLNISNFAYTDDNIRYGERISSLVGDKHFIIDTSRNGLGPAPNGEWCNPPGRALGTRPTARTGHPLVDAFYWLKWPGQSDGECRGFPPAGTWLPEYALGLAERARY